MVEDDDPRGIPFHLNICSLMPSTNPFMPRPEVKNSEVVKAAELKKGDGLVIWSRFNTPRTEELRSIEYHDDAVVILRGRCTLPEVVPNDWDVMRKKRRR